VARKIRQMPKGKTTPIVMISGVYKNELHQREAVEHYGAFAFLEKPFKLSALQDILKAALKDRYPAQPQAAAPADEVTEEASRANSARRTRPRKRSSWWSGPPARRSRGRPASAATSPRRRCRRCWRSCTAGRRAARCSAGAAR